jgi:hypothetical protein
LESWLQLGLLSNNQVRDLAQLYLTCPYIPVVSPAVAPTPVHEFIAPPVSPLPRRPLGPQILTGLMAEIGVVWLLALGVFLVVISSAVLAVSQWYWLSPVGQYAILLGYTLAFGLAGLWASRREQLRLTGQMLQIATLLIVPVNVWMMDGLRLWRSPLGWGVIILASLILVGLNWRLMRGSSRLSQLNSVGLSGLHWGWSLSGGPLLLTYLGVGGTVLLQLMAQARRARTAPAFVEVPAARGLPSGAIAIVVASLLLVGRALWAAGVPIYQLGLAITLAGWLLVRLQRASAPPTSRIAGGVLLVLGWAVSLLHDPQPVQGLDPLWQTLAVSGLALAVVLEQLWRTRSLLFLLTAWAIGLQTYALLRVLVPLDLRHTLIHDLMQWAGLRSGTWELLGVGFFPYLVLTVLMAGYWRRQQEPLLAQGSDQLAWGWGLLLAIPSSFNPLVRAIYSSLAAGLLGVLLYQRRQGLSQWPSGRASQFVLITHATAVLAGLSWVLWGWPQLSAATWTWILLGSALVLWGGAGLSHDRLWQASGWYLGLALAACSYPLLLQALELERELAVNWEGGAVYAGLPWLVVPAALMGLSYVPCFFAVQRSNWLSVVAVGLGLILGFTRLTPFIITLGGSTLVMVGNTQRLRSRFSAVLTVGLGLGWLSLEGWSLLGKFEARWYLVWAAGLVGLLWLVWDRWGAITDRPAVAHPLADLYRPVLDGWARGIALFEGILLSLVVLFSLNYADSLPWRHLTVSIGLMLGAIAYRTYRQPQVWGLWGLAWAVALLINAVAEWLDGSGLDREIASLIMGEISLWVGDRGIARRAPVLSWTQSLTWHGIPLLYALLACLLAHAEFTALSGGVMAGVAGIVLGVSRRQAELKPLRYLGLVGLSIAAYEALIYQLTQRSDVGIGMALTLLAALAAVIGLAQIGLQRWLAPALLLEPSDLDGVMGLHWCVGSLLVLLALPGGLSGMVLWIWTGTVAGLALVASGQGRRQGFWIYPALAQGVWALATVVHQLWPQLSLAQWGAALASGLALALYRCPWPRWGWPRLPWQRASTLLPGVIVGLSAGEVNISSLLLTAGCYSAMAWLGGTVRLSYVGLGLALWAGWRWLLELHWSDPLWYVALLSAALLIVVRLDPSLQAESAQETRHWLRCLALSLVCLTAFYSPSGSGWLRGLLTIGAGLGLGGVGLVLRTRAYLYIGTLTFMAAVLRQSWWFVADQSLLLWLGGIGLGLLLIWIAATFESRRTQAMAWLQYWSQELARWE